MSISLVILEDSSSYEGLVKSSVRCMPAFRIIEDSVGYCLEMLARGVYMLAAETFLMSLSTLFPHVMMFPGRDGRLG